MGFGDAASRINQLAHAQLCVAKVVGPFCAVFADCRLPIQDAYAACAVVHNEREATARVKGINHGEVGPKGQNRGDAVIAVNR